MLFLTSKACVSCLLKYSFIFYFSFDLPHILNRRASSITGAALQQQQQQQQQQSDAPGTLSRQGSAIFAFNFTPVIPGKHTTVAVVTVIPQLTTLSFTNVDAQN